MHILGLEKRAWRIKSKFVEFESDCTEDADTQEIVDREAEEMQQFFLAYHNRGDNLPCHESAGSALDGQESADSAPDGPHAKAASIE